ncbi:uncharacterized protein LOC132392364 [Hypanus sabinus]|uniref:uncharacterized protein LOC132392364 n=1 Tax=Hypanus sabinus TaxID=79690 RepID=UPI0028C38677|nr:uncharacterized protein LOC132392364 [Hypanus sabinus]
MESILRPDRLDLDPQSQEAGNAFKLWLVCFESYLEEIQVTETTTMHRVLLSRVSPWVYSMIRDQPSYQGAMDTLKRQYLRPVNTVYARHHLATWQQRAAESSAEFVRALQTLVWACDWRGLTAEQHAELLVRDAFVTGIRSMYVRQWLLEHTDLTLHSAAELADMLEAALHNADALQVHDLPPASWTLQTPQPAGESSTVAARRKIAKCYFCGLELHPRKRCPARGAVERRATSPSPVSPNRERGQLAPRAKHGGGHLGRRHLVLPTSHGCLPGTPPCRTKIAIQL